MNTGKKRSRPLLMFYILVAYVFIQFSWWTFSMFRLNNEVSHLKTELNLLKGESPEEVMQKGNEINAKLEKRWVMISGESAVFVGLLLLGIYQVRRTLKKENELAERQKNFLLSVTHELKSPLASTKLQLQTLEKHELARPQQKEILGNAVSDVDRLTKLVENILMAAKIDNKVIPMNRETVDLSTYLQEGVEQTIRSSAFKQKVLLDVQPDIQFAIDKIHFPSIILNLLENAAKYSPADSTIRISLKKTGGQIIFRLSDEGYGIPAEEKERVLEKFYRVGNEETRRAKGTGLGLYIVNYLVECHQGTLHISDNQPKGTVFEITFQA